MTLDISQFIANSLYNQCRIHHFTCDISVGKTSTLKKAIRAQITSEMGDSFLNDADYIIFFKGGNINDADAAVKLFNITDDALGRFANTIAKSDVKKIKDDESDEVAFRFVKVTVK